MIISQTIKKQQLILNLIFLKKMIDIL